ncbi:MAG: site-specific DNA-methyltransferase [Spirochaetaceae bacterium]|nr:site-specific DNA-methyltransferase [Spirochaetaceae bacterium]
MGTTSATMGKLVDLDEYLPESVRTLVTTRQLDTTIPTMAKKPEVLADIAAALRRIPTHHHLHCGDARTVDFIDSESVHLVVTSPPYWTLKRYNESPDQLGHVDDYEEFLDALDGVWRLLFDALVPGGRVVCVVGDVCLSRRKNNGEHTCVPLHSSIQERCRRIGFSNLAPIIWHKIANASYEVEGNSRFLGKPYEPNGVIKNDIEYILMLRKPGGYRKPTRSARLLSVIGNDDHKKWFRQIWSDVTGASTRDHPAPYPLELATRLVRMFSFVGDTVVGPFMGTATTNLAAAISGRNSIGIEIDEEYMQQCVARISSESADLFSEISVTTSAPGSFVNVCTPPLVSC